MRIRKKAKQDGVAISISVNNNSHTLCKFNQSPWDLSPPSQIQGEELYKPNGSFPYSVQNIESLDEMKISSNNGDENLSNNHVKKTIVLENEILMEDPGKVLCAETNAELWQCKKEVVTKGCNEVIQASGVKKEKSAVTGSSKKRVVPGSDSEFYYYSGFGPSWAAKQRGSRSDQQNRKEPVTAMEVDDCFDSSNNVDEMEDESAEIVRKRARKPVKARSLSNF